MIIIVVVIIIIVVSLYYSTITKQFIHVHFTMSFSTPNGYSLNLMFYTSQYFTTKPYACDPSTLPRYPPNKEIDAKSRDAKCREEARR